VQLSPHIYRLAALITLSCVVVMAVGFGSPYSIQLLQPSLPGPANADFFLAIRETPRSVLAFMATDTLFIFGYLMVFIGLYATTKTHNRILASVAMGFGLAAGSFDMLENSYLSSYALQSLHGQTLSEPALPLIYVLASMKWLSVFLTSLLYGLLWDRNTIYNGILSASMLAFPMLGILTIAIPVLIPFRILPLIISMAMLAWSFQDSR